MRTLEVTQIRKHAQSRHPPSQQPLGCHAMFSCSFQHQTLVTKTEYTDPQDMRTEP